MPIIDSSSERSSGLPTSHFGYDQLTRHDECQIQRELANFDFILAALRRNVVIPPRDKDNSGMRLGTNLEGLDIPTPEAEQALGRVVERTCDFWDAHVYCAEKGIKSTFVKKVDEIEKEIFEKPKINDIEQIVPMTQVEKRYQVTKPLIFAVGTIAASFGGVIFSHLT